MQIVLSPQFAVPSVQGLDPSSRPILLMLEIRTAFSCEKYPSETFEDFNLVFTFGN